MRFIVYAHTTPPPERRLFYVGKGTEQRSRTDQGRSHEWHREVIASGGFEVVEVDAFYDDKEAYLAEEEFISLARAMGVQLVNKSAGGRGPKGATWRHSRETRERMSLAHTGKPNYAAMGPRPAQRKAVRCETNGLVFECIRDAAAWVGRINAYSSIAKCARGERSMAYGHQWSYVSTILA